MPFGLGLGCDCCCVCGAFCSGGECGDTLELQGTTSGATNGGCASCASLNAVFAFLWSGSLTAVAWNTVSPATIGKPTGATDAKAGSRVCQWYSSDVAAACSSPFEARVEGFVLSIYQDTDDKWHAAILIDYSDGFASFELSGDTEFPGDGATIDCTEFSVSIPLSVTDGTPFYCNPPTSILLENAA